MVRAVSWNRVKRRSNVPIAKSKKSFAFALINPKKWAGFDSSLWTVIQSTCMRLSPKKPYRIGLRKAIFPTARCGPTIASGCPRSWQATPSLGVFCFWAILCWSMRLCLKSI
ncbi:UNVERIFIED_CONTAM: hypothetical protein GTU68_051556 [Idotea baltica]|nr:hypothetical protein [Idotea baltica]